MITFKSVGNSVCPICNTSDEGEATLVPIDGTDEDGICEAQPIHINCIGLRFNKDMGAFYQKVNHPTPSQRKESNE